MTSVNLETAEMNEAEIEKLWEAFKVFDADGSGAISPEELGSVMNSLGQNLSQIELKEMIKEVDIDLSGTIDFEEFKALMVSKKGDRLSRLKLAFSVFDEDGNGRITVQELHNIMGKFELTKTELEEMLKEVDRDGSGSIDFDEFCQLMPEKLATKTYQDSPTISLNSPQKETKTNVPEIVSDSTESDTVIETEIERLKQQLEQPKNQDKRGTSRLQINANRVVSFTSGCRLSLLP